LREYSVLTIREELSVTRAIERAVEEHPLADDIYGAAAWRIARELECGTPLVGVPEGYRVLNLLPNREARTPGLLVRYFREGVQMVTVDWIEFYPYDEALAVRPLAYIK
jgi:hypothetical protein